MAKKQCASKAAPKDAAKKTTAKTACSKSVAKKDKKIRLGLFGAGRGRSLAEIGKVLPEFELVAVCEGDPNRLQWAKDDLGGSLTYDTDFETFIRRDFDAVILANYATEHAPYAVKALNAGKHVLSECMAMLTMAEAVELAEAVEKSGKVYYFAENYPFFAQNLEIRRLVQSGEMGNFLYGEAEYVHPATAEERAGLYSGPDHWRTWTPVTYYCTHSMGPIMHITGLRPVRVNGFVVPRDPTLSDFGPGSLKRDDTVGILMCTMENGAVVKIMPCAKLRDHGNRTRVCCANGSMEYNQGHGRILRVVRPKTAADWPAETPYETYYYPEFPKEYQDAVKYGHGGGDYFMLSNFRDAILGKCPPAIDVYKAIDMTAIGILGYRSALENGVPFEVPDFRDPAVREKYRNDDWNPDPARHRKGMPYPSVTGNVKISKKDLEIFRKLKGC